jgi:hypothetical protein
MTEHNPQKYRQFSAPATAEEAVQKLEAFSAGVAELRDRLGIPDVIMMARINHLQGDEEVSAAITSQLGDATVGAMMAAQFFGMQQEALMASLKDSVATGRKHARS